MGIIPNNSQSNNIQPNVQPNQQMYNYILKRIMSMAIESIFDMDESEEQRADYRSYIDAVAWMQEHGTVPDGMVLIDDADRERANMEAAFIHEFKPLNSQLFQYCLDQAFYPSRFTRIDRIGLIRFCCERGAIPSMKKLLMLINYTFCDNVIENLVDVVVCCQEQGLNIHESDDILMSFTQCYPNLSLCEYLTGQGCVSHPNHEERVCEYLEERSDE